MEDGKVDKVIKALEALYDAMHKNQCYACSYEFVEVAKEFGTEIIADALELLKEYKRQDGCPCAHCMEWECDEVCEEYKKWKDT